MSKEGVDIKSLQVFEDENFLVGKFTEQVDILKKVEDLPALIVLFFNSIFECGCVKKDVDKLSKLIIEGDQSKIQSEYNLMLASCNLYNYKNKFSKIIFINNTSSDYMLLDSSSLNTISNVKKQLSKDFKIFGNLTTKKVSGVGRDKYSPQITYLG